LLQLLLAAYCSRAQANKFGIFVADLPSKFNRDLLNVAEERSLASFIQGGIGPKMDVALGVRGFHATYDYRSRLYKHTHMISSAE